MRQRTLIVLFVSVCLSVILPGCRNEFKEFIYEEILDVHVSKQNEQNNNNQFNKLSVDDLIANDNDKEAWQPDKLQTPPKDQENADLVTARKNAWSTYSRFYAYYSKWHTPNELLDRYKKNKYGSAKKIPSVVRLEFNSRDLKLSDLKEARKTSLGEEYETLEQYIDEMIESIEVFNPTLENLERYVLTREYLVDDGALLKSQDAAFIEQATAFVRTYQKFSVELERMDLIRFEEKVAEMKKSGMSVEAAIDESKLALRQIIAYCKEPDKLKTPETQKKVTAKIDELKKSLDNLHEEIAKVQNEDSDKHYRDIEKYLLELLGYARTFGTQYRIKDCNRLIDEYNSANSSINTRLEIIRMRRDTFGGR